eukprot:m.177336 g.177336  ORF g.177336 m.177336 type:complete len:64 (-) comp13545_c2_seq13:4-195(-)
MYLLLVGQSGAKTPSVQDTPESPAATRILRPIQQQQHHEDQNIRKSKHIHNTHMQTPHQRRRT